MTTWSDVGIDLPSGATGEVDTTCPMCSGGRKKARDRCLSVNVDKGVWECMHCGWSGGLGAIGWNDPLHPAGARPKVYERPRPIPQVVTPDLWEQAVAFIARERGIPEAVLVRNRVAIAKEWCRVCEREMSHILFPVYRDGEHVNTKHRCVHKHFRMEPGAERVLYGLDDVIGNPIWIWVEGEYDKLACEVAGYPNVVSVPDGAPSVATKNYTSKFAYLEAAEDAIMAAANHVIAVDADDAGTRLKEELIRRLGKEKCLVVTWPDGVKDANACLTTHGASALAGAIARARHVPVEGIVTVDDISADLDTLYERGFDRGSVSGWVAFDRHYRARPGLVTIVTGVPGHGKSSFVDALTVNLAVRHGWSFAVCSPENQPVERHVAGLMTRYMDKPFHDGPTKRMTREEMEHARAWVEEHYAFILPEEPTVDAILDRAKVLIYRMGVKGIVIDPWNEIDHSRPPGLSETEYVSRCLSLMRRFARHHDVHLWLVAHPTKMSKDADGRETVPGLWDISGSAHFRNKADYGLSIYRDLSVPANPVDVHVTKVRFAETGELGRVGFTFDRVTGRYREG